MTGKRSTQQNEREDVKPLLLMYAEAIEKTQRDLDAARQDLKRDYKANQDILNIMRRYIQHPASNQSASASSEQGGEAGVKPNCLIRLFSCQLNE